MNRRHFLAFSGLIVSGIGSNLAWSAEGKPVTDKEVLKEGQPATVPNYCENPSKQPNKFCPTKPGGICGDCMFYNRDNSKTTFKGKEVAKCQLLANPAQPQYVSTSASCASWVKKA